MAMPFGLWMALARATPLEGWRFEDAQGHLGDTSEPSSAASPLPPPPEN
jgi:hypothetical protein